MLLSICIPTHHGRGWSVSPLVNALIDQILADDLQELVEICVSDNASTDETQTQIEIAKKRLPDSLKYYRFDLNVGVFNFLNSVRMASGEFCWFIGSDDVPAPGAVKTAVELLKRYPNCSGMSSLFDIYDFKMENRRPSRPDSLYPVNIETERQFETFSDALTQLSPSQTFMSTQIFRRLLWNDMIANEPSTWVYVARHHAHTYALALIMKRDPHWVWTPARLVHMRDENGEVHQFTSAQSYTHAVMVLADMVTIWAKVTGKDRELFRSVLRKAYKVDWTPRVVRHTKMLPNHGAKDDWGMLVSYTRYLASLPDYWFGTFLALLIPHWIWKVAGKMRGRR